jgi:hypothetical protein
MRRFLWSKGLPIGIVAFWIIMMGLLMGKVYFHPADEYLEVDGDLLQGFQNRVCP